MPPWRISHLESSRQTDEKDTRIDFSISGRARHGRVEIYGVTSPAAQHYNGQIGDVMRLRWTFGRSSAPARPSCRSLIICDTMDASPMQLPFFGCFEVGFFFDIGYTNALGYRAPFLHGSGGAGGFSVYIRSGSIARGTPHSLGYRTIKAWQAACHLAA